MALVVPVTETLGAYLKALRSARGVSLRHLALRAGIAPSTVSRWEAGRTLPRLPELDVYLSSLAATPQERARALVLLNAPRSVVRVGRRAEAEASADGVPFLCVSSVGGGLIRALRLRSERSQADLARSVGVSVAAVSAWERSERWPSSEHLHSLCWYLGASEMEIAALTMGPRVGFLPLNPDESGPAALHTIDNHFRAHLYEGWSGAGPLSDCSYLELSAVLSPLARQSPDARLLLAEVCAWQTFSLVESERYREAISVAERTLELLPDKTRPPWFAIYAVLGMAQSIAQGSRRKSPFADEKRAERALRVLSLWLDDDVATPMKHWTPSGTWNCAVYIAWSQASFAEYLLLTGDRERAALYSEASIENAENSGHRSEIYRRRMDEARTLLTAGLPKDALLRAARLPGRYSASQEAEYCLLNAQAMLALKSRRDAEVWLHDAETWIARESEDYLRKRLTVQARQVSQQF